MVLNESSFRADAGPAHRRAGTRTSGRGTSGGDDRRALPRAPAGPGSGVPTQEIYTLFGRAVALPTGTRRLVGVAATGMTACPCARGAGGCAGARAPAGKGFQRRADREGLRERASRDPRPARTRHLHIGCPEECDTEIEAASLLEIVEGSMSWESTS